ncbi:MAG: hypothetical protein FD175_2589 [Beijerinckiaceae bacterium]|nr:MAG: hypothetical protein FD175_2589 [Beijerinckiaceae bacterium]
MSARLSTVMAGFSPAIHDFAACMGAFDVMDTRPKGGHDGLWVAALPCTRVRETCS